MDADDSDEELEGVNTGAGLIDGVWEELEDDEGTTCVAMVACDALDAMPSHQSMHACHACLHCSKRAASLVYHGRLSFVPLQDTFFHESPFSVHSQRTCMYPLFAV